MRSNAAMKKRSRLLAMFAALFGAVVVGLGATNAVAAPRAGAVALSTTLCCGSSSPEVKAATAAGLTTTIVDPVTWDSMTTADFKKFKLIIESHVTGPTIVVVNPPAVAP